MPGHGLSPGASRRRAPAAWVEFPQAEWPDGRPPARRPHAPLGLAMDKLVAAIIAAHTPSLRISLERGLLFRPSTSGDWGQRAERLGRSLGAYTPAPSTPSSLGALVQPGGPVAGSAMGWIGRLFSGGASGLDAFSPYPRRRGCPALPCRTTGRPEAAIPRSSRTRGTLPSGDQHPQQVESVLSRDGLNPSRIPLSSANSRALGPCCGPRMGRDDDGEPILLVDGDSRRRRANYSRGNFSVTSSPQQWGHE